MGASSYDYNTRSVRTATFTAATNTDQIFTQNVERKIHPEMDPKGINLREARDSDVHPESFPIVIHLDVTGSMGKIPFFMIRHGLPQLIEKLQNAGIKSPSILFIAGGDTHWDRAPLQVGQFESGDEELDMWLTRTYLEGGGGGGGQESYNIVWHFVANACKTDSWEKRRKKGVVITIGDESTWSYIDKNDSNFLHPDLQVGSQSIPNSQVIDRLREQWDPYHLFVQHGSNYHIREAVPQFKALLGEQNVLMTQYESEQQNDLIQVMTRAILNTYGTPASNTDTVKQEVNTPATDTENNNQEILL